MVVHSCMYDVHNYGFNYSIYRAILSIYIYIHRMLGQNVEDVHSHRLDLLAMPAFSIEIHI